MSLTLADRIRIVDGLLAVPDMTTPGVRDAMYSLLPDVLAQHQARHATARMEADALVTVCENHSGSRPWVAVLAALSVLRPRDPAVSALANVLSGLGLVAPDDKWEVRA
ncbi:hypothetical protein GCM10009557_07250 [Virgisporangium ochraceum]|uniref:Effector-associated domain-containing protein n=1 Tax=Virgisporangium ochraceum TaxID=65505 RepID=A0A8J4A5D0_9ACTN|nr:hypothetical protein [Virgisporangium ochraceum]GIJ74528.1 hypothetical protein Voc01_094450 [Virgisporangium ochraceum]